jgi:hypothetical protein
MLALVLIAAPLLSSCVAMAVAGAAVGATGAVVTTGVKATGAVIGAIIPDGDDDKDRDHDRHHHHD